MIQGPVAQALLDLFEVEVVLEQHGQCLAGGQRREQIDYLLLDLSTQDVEELVLGPHLRADDRHLQLHEGLAIVLVLVLNYYIVLFWLHVVGVSVAAHSSTILLFPSKSGEQFKSSLW